MNAYCSTLFEWTFNVTLKSCSKSFKFFYFIQKANILNVCDPMKLYDLKKTLKFE